MNDIISKYLRNELSTLEREKLQEWLTKHVDNTNKLEELKLIWNQSSGLRKNYRPDTDEAWQQILLKLSNDKKVIPIYRWVAGIAASFLIAGFIIYAFVKSDAVTYKSMADVKSSFVLPDGSEVWLNKDSKLDYVGRETERTILLVGEGYFDVVNNPNRPFIIQTGDLRTQVIGTSFNVDASNEGDIDVVVSSGRVLVFDQQDSIFLDPGELGAYDLVSKSLTNQLNTDANFDAWRTGVLRFNDTPINQVIRDLEEHYDTELVAQDSSEAKLNGTFDNQPLGEVLDEIFLSTDVEVLKAN